jgi:hypothetical protein
MLQYLIKLSISLSVVYIFYQLFLRRLTFYNWNRWYLLIYSMVCFGIPFINVFTLIVKEPALRESAFVNYIPAITQLEPPLQTTNTTGFNWLLVTAAVLVTGMIAMAVRLVIQYYSLFKMRKKAVLLYDDTIKLYHVDAPVIPFSFGRGIYINQHQHGEAELKEIIRHEFIHVKQRHSLDIVWSELLCMLNWYNPFAWLLRHDIRQNLEFIADQQVLQTGLDRKQYQYLLLKVIGVNSFSIATSFNFSSLKKRIAMMNKAQSARVHLIRFLFLLPLLVVVLLAFRNRTQGHYQPLRTAVTDTVPAASQPPGWKDIETVDVNDSQVTVRLNNKTVEKYDLSNAKDREAFESRYGPLPSPPPPPTPPVAPDRADRALPRAPKAPVKLELREAPEKPEAPEKAEKLEYVEAPYPPTPPPPPAPVDPGNCINSKGNCITIAYNGGEQIVIVKDKNNKIVQAVTLTDWLNDKQYETQYGEIPDMKVLKGKHAVTKAIVIEDKPLAAIEPEVVVRGKPAIAVSVDPTPATKVVNEVQIKELRVASTTPIQFKGAYTPVKQVRIKPARPSPDTKPAEAAEPGSGAAPAKPASPTKEQ